MKRWIAAILSCVMLLTMMPAGVIGETPASVDSGSAQECADTELTNDAEPDASETGGADLTEEETELILPVLGEVLSDPLSAADRDGYGTLMYLSDYQVSEMVLCKVGWGSYTRDKDLDGKSISLIVDGETKSFYKGVTAHATACLIYDLGENHGDYDLFKAYIGVDSDRGTNGNVKFTFSGSVDGEVWTVLLAPSNEFTGNSNALSVSLNIEAYRFFKVDISSNGANTADHSVLADACFVTDGYTPPVIETLKDGEIDMDEAYFEAELEGVTAAEMLEDEATERTLLQYTLVRSCGYRNLYTFLTTSEDYRSRINAFTWLFNDLEVLREFMNGGIPSGGSYLSALDVLSDLYAAYQDDLEDKTPLRKGEVEGMVRGGLYRRMMLTMSLVCANGLGAWLARAEVSNPVNRYAYFKENYLAEKMRDEIFENLGVDEMRWVLGNNISDAEIVWLNDYARAHPRGGNQTSYPILYSPHHHIAYRWYDYDKDIYYAEENRAYYTEKYMLTEEYEKYGLVYGYTESGEKVAQRLWQVFEDGAVCGNISRTGANLAASFGVPACEVGQPGHAAFLIMNKGSDNQMIWGIDNDISGWTQSSNSRRMPADWGNSSDSWNSGWKVPYVLLAQAALNDEENYRKAEEILMLLPLASTPEAQEEICRSALDIMPFHLDAWLELINLACGDAERTSSQLAELAKELCAGEMKFYPKPLNDLMQLIFNRLNVMISAGDENARVDLARAQLLFREALTAATKATDSDTAQPGATKTVASSILNQSDLALATFSFDGENAGKIVFREGFTSVRFRLCLDGETWVFHQLNAVGEEAVSYELTEEELNSLRADKDILIWLDGWPGDQDGNPIPGDAFSIDILAGSKVTDVEFNDHENRFLGNMTGMEYSVDNGVTWLTLTDDILFTGTQHILIHRKANGTTLMGPDSAYSSTPDNTTDRVYIPISRLSVAAFSSQQESQNDYAAHTIDGLYSTRWHTLWNGTDQKKFITIQTDEPTYFSGFEYTPSVGNGTVYSGQVLVSLDGESWVTAQSFSGWANDTGVKSLTFSPVYGQYVKFVVTGSVGGFVSARALELFEDTTIKDKQVIGVSLLTLPEKRSYVRGEALDLTGASAQMFFSDGSKTILPISMLTPGTRVLWDVGSQEITLTYLNFPPVSFHVTVEERDFEPTSLSLVTPPDKVSYYAGDTLSSEGMELTATDGETTVYLAPGDYTLSADLIAEGEKTVVVQMKETSLTAHYQITVKKAVKSLKVTADPDKLVYELGDALDTTGLEVTVVYMDETERVLAETEYLTVNAESFSEEAGSYDIPVVLADRNSVETSFHVTVYPYFTKDGIRYSAMQDHTCSVIAVNSEASFVSIPQSVRFGSTVYTVTRVGADVLVGAPGVTGVSLPGSILKIEENAFGSGQSLTDVYLTAHTGFENMTIADSAFDETVKISVYASSKELEDELAGQIQEKPFAESVQTGNIASDIQAITVNPPTVTTVNRGESLNMDGFAVFAVLNDGKTLPLDPSSVNVSSVNTNMAGTYSVTVTLLSNESVTTSYRVVVMKSNLMITENPQDAFYRTTDAVVTPLRVSAKSDGAHDVLLYQWYRSSSRVMDPEHDKLEGATGKTYTPKEKGYYYAIVSIQDTDYYVFSMMAEISIGDFAAVVGNKGYDTLSAAMQDAAAGDTVEILKDITLSSGITVDKSLMIEGNGHTVLRGQGFAETMFTMNGAGADGITVRIQNLTLDGGAGWYGDVEPNLERACLSDNIASAPIISATGNTKLYLDENTVLQNNYNNYNGKSNTLYGGAVNAVGSTRIELNGAVIRNNYSFLFGAAVYHRDNTTLVINDGLIHGNSGSAEWNTTAICADNKAVCIINGGQFCHNVGADKGDVLWVSDGSLEINGGVFEHNTSNNEYSIYVNGSSSVTVSKAEKLGSIYLYRNNQSPAAGITVGADIPESGLQIFVRDGAFPEGTAIVTVKEGVNARELQGKIKIGDDFAGINDEGKLVKPCSSHTAAADWITVRASTCSVEGEEMQVCRNCSYCMATRAIQTTAHIPVELAMEAARCGIAGHEAGSYCRDCGQTISGLEPIQALEHSFTVCVETSPADCTTAGKITYRCEHCTETQDQPIDMLGHKLITVHTATCEESGYVITKCERCQEEFEKTPEDAKGHRFGDASWVWAEDGKSATATITCDCSATRSATATVSNGGITSVVSEPATTEKMGKTTYTAEVTLEGATYESSKTVEDIPKIEEEKDNFFRRMFKSIRNFFKKLFGG